MLIWKKGHFLASDIQSVLALHEGIFLDLTCDHMSGSSSLRFVLLSNSAKGRIIIVIVISLRAQVKMFLVKQLISTRESFLVIDKRLHTFVTCGLFTVIITYDVKTSSVQSNSNTLKKLYHFSLVLNLTNCKIKRHLRIVHCI